jgi:hypothetical protein
LTLTVETDQKGQAEALGFRPNKLLGKFEIRVNASYAGQEAEMELTLTNVGHKSHTGTKVVVAVVIVVVVVVAVLAGIVLVTRHGPAR